MDPNTSNTSHRIAPDDISRVKLAKGVKLGDVVVDDVLDIRHELLYFCEDVSGLRIIERGAVLLREHKERCDLASNVSKKYQQHAAVDEWQRPTYMSTLALWMAVSRSTAPSWMTCRGVVVRFQVDT